MIKLALVGLIFAGCISSGDANFGDATADTNAPDVDVDAVEVEVDVSDRPETLIEETDVDGQGCTSATDCAGEPPQCTKWICSPTGTCEVAPKSGGSCDDGDLCTGPGTCAGGQCMPGDPLTCEGATACGRPVCDPVSGCGIVPVDGGFCEASGVEWGTCDGLRMAPIDLCDASICVDQSTPLTVPVPIGKVEGDWFVVSAGAILTGVNAFAGLASFAPDGRWGGTFRTNNTTFVLDDVLGRRSWCTDANNGLGLQLSVNDFVGQVDASGSVMVASGRAGNEVLVGLRPTGTAADVNGTYAVLFVGAKEDKSLRLWSGTAVFATGCLTEQIDLVESREREPIAVAPRACLGTPKLGLFTLELSASTGPAEAVSLTLHGAVSEGGEMLLFERAMNENQIAPGMVLMIRLGQSASSRFVGSTRWIQALQESNSNTVNTYAGVAGGVFFNGPTLLNGSLGAELITGDRVDFDDYGRFLLSLRTPRRNATYSGYLVNRLGFGFFYEVEAPDNWATLFEVTEIPSRAAWGVMVNRP